MKEEGTLRSRGVGFPGTGVLALAVCSIFWLSNHVSKVSPPHFYSKGDHGGSLDGTSIWSDETRSHRAAHRFRTNFYLSIYSFSVNGVSG